MYHVRRWRYKTGVSREEVVMLLFGRGKGRYVGLLRFLWRLSSHGKVSYLVFHIISALNSRKF